MPNNDEPAATVDPTDEASERRRAFLRRAALAGISIPAVEILIAAENSANASVVMRCW